MKKAAVCLVAVLGSALVTAAYAQGAQMKVAGPSYPVSVPIKTSTVVSYTIQSNVGTNPNFKIYPSLVSSATTVSAGSIVQSGGTCSAGIAYGHTCTIELTYTAPGQLPRANPVTASIVFGYNGQNTVPQVGAFMLGTPSLTSISPNTGSVMGGQTVTITGNYLSTLLAKSKKPVDIHAQKAALGANPVVTFDGQAAKVLSASNTQLVVLTPNDTANYVAPGGKATSGGSVQPGTSSGSAGGKGRPVKVMVTTSGGELATTYTYVGLGDNYGGGIIYALNVAGNPGGKVVTKNDMTYLDWYQANANCNNMGWSLPDPYADGANPSIIPGQGVPLSGDFALLNGSGQPYAGMNPYRLMSPISYWGGPLRSTPKYAARNAWTAGFGTDLAGQGQSFESKDAALSARCVRTFAE